MKTRFHAHDLFQEGVSRVKAHTRAFAKAVMDHLGELPEHLAPDSAPDEAFSERHQERETPAQRQLVGIDIFVHETERDPIALAEKLLVSSRNLTLELQTLSNRGVKVWPPVLKENFCYAELWRCRFIAKPGAASNAAVNWMLLRELNLNGVDVIKTENLYVFDGETAYSAGQRH